MERIDQLHPLVGDLLYINAFAYCGPLIFLGWETRPEDASTSSGPRRTTPVSLSELPVCFYALTFDSGSWFYHNVLRRPFGLFMSNAQARVLARYDDSVG